MSFIDVIYPPTKTMPPAEETIALFFGLFLSIVGLYTPSYWIKIVIGAVAMVFVFASRVAMYQRYKREITR